MTRGFRLKSGWQEMTQPTSGDTTNWRNVSARVALADRFPAGRPGRGLTHHKLSELNPALHSRWGETTSS